MAGNGTTVAEIGQRRIERFALGHRDGAAGMEPAAGRRPQGARDLSRHDHAWPCSLDLRIGHRHGCQFVDGDRFVCDLCFRVPNIDPKVANPDGLDIFTFRAAGPRQWEITLDLDKMPDLSVPMMLGLVEMVNKQTVGSTPLTAPDLVALTEKMKRAALAVTRLGVRNHYIDFRVVAPRVVSSQGAYTSDATSARFRLSFVELMDMLLRPAARSGRRFQVVVGH